MRLEVEIKQTKPFRNIYHKASVNLIYTGKWMMQIQVDILKSYNLTLQQYNILRILRGQFPNAATVKLVRDRMLDRMSDASRIIELLRKKDLVERHVNDLNRRKMDVRITQKGVDLLIEIENENDRMDLKLRSLNEDELLQLNSLLDKLRN